VLPRVPKQVEAVRWVQTVHARCYVRKVKQDGTVLVAEDRHYNKQALAEQDVAIQVDAAVRAFVVRHRQQAIKQVAIKGLYGGPLAFADSLALMHQEARPPWRPWRWSGRNETTFA
jgi:hypothetical protein